MKSGTFIIGNKLGIHARPAAEIVKMIADYNCEVQFEVNGKSINGKSVLMIISAGIKKDASVTVNVEGEKEEELFNKLSDYIGNGFYED